MMTLKIHLKKICLLTLSLLLLASNTQLALAQSDSATGSADEEATQNLKKRIERVVQDKKEEIESAIVSLSNQKRGFIGQVQRLSEEAVTIKNPKGTQIVPVNDTVSILKGGKTIELDDIAVDDWVLVLGYQQEDDFEPRRITVSSASLRPKDYTVVLGSVTEIARSSVTVAPRSSQAEEETTEFSLVNSTSYEDLEGQEIVRTDITEDMQVLVVGYVDEDGDRTATAVKALTVIDEDESDE